MHSNCPLTRREVGRAAWAHLHTMAAYYPDRPSQQQQKDMAEMMQQLMRFYPCGYCSERSVEELERNPPQVASQRDLSRWLCSVHNEVNERLGKPVFDCSKVDIRWRTGPADGSCS